MAACPSAWFQMLSTPSRFFSLNAGDRLTFLSDGVIEATNANRELFGFERTQVISGKPAMTIANAARDFGQEDDITVLTLQRTALA